MKEQLRIVVLGMVYRFFFEMGNQADKDRLAHKVVVEELKAEDENSKPTTGSISTYYPLLKEIKKEKDP